MIVLSGCGAPVATTVGQPSLTEAVSSRSRNGGPSHTKNVSWEAGVILADRSGYQCLSLEAVGLPPSAEVVFVTSSCDCIAPSLVKYATSESKHVSGILLYNFRSMEMRVAATLLALCVLCWPTKEGMRAVSHSEASRVFGSADVFPWQDNAKCLNWPVTCAGDSLDCSFFGTANCPTGIIKVTQPGKEANFCTAPNPGFQCKVTSNALPDACLISKRCRPLTFFNGCVEDSVVSWINGNCTDRVAQ